MRARYFAWLMILVLLAACAPQEDAAVVEEVVVEEVAAVAETAAPPTNTPEPPPPTATNLPVPTDVPTVEAVAEVVEAATEVVATDVPPTDVPPTEAVPTAEPVDFAMQFGRTAEGVYFHGAEDAPVTIIDYSDFL